MTSETDSAKRIERLMTLYAFLDRLGKPGNVHLIMTVDGYKLNDVELKILMILAESGSNLSMSRFGHALGITQNNVSNYIKRLKEVGLIDTVQQGRIKMPHITPKGLDTLSEICRDRYRALTQMMDKMDESQLTVVDEAIESLLKGAEDMLVSAW